MKFHSNTVRVGEIPPYYFVLGGNMTCRICGETAPVYKTIKENDHVLRYLKCNKCGHDFRTLEMDEDMWRSISTTKKFEEITSTIDKAIKDHVKVSPSGSTYRMAQYIAHRLFTEVSHEV